MQNGRLSLRFQSVEICKSVKECVDKHCSAYEKKNIIDMRELLEKCSIMGSENNQDSASTTKAIADWSDFQQA